MITKTKRQTRRRQKHFHLRQGAGCSNAKNEKEPLCLVIYAKKMGDLVLADVAAAGTAALQRSCGCSSELLAWEVSARFCSPLLAWRAGSFEASRTKSRGRKDKKHRRDGAPGGGLFGSRWLAYRGGGANTKSQA